MHYTGTWNYPGVCPGCGYCRCCGRYQGHGSPWYPANTYTYCTSGAASSPSSIFSYGSCGEPMEPEEPKPECPRD